MSLKFLKTDAIVNIGIGSGFVQRIQQIVMYIIKDVPKDKLEEYKQLIKEGKEMNEPWMEHLTTLSVLLREIEVKADEQNLSYEMDEDAAKSSISEE
jgi:hypothetical protein